MRDHPADECLPYSCTLGLGYILSTRGKAISGAIINIHLYVYNRDECCENDENRYKCSTSCYIFLDPQCGGLNKESLEAV